MPRRPGGPWRSPEAARRRQRLRAGQPGLVVLSLDTKPFDEAVGDVTARLDDAYWEARLRQPFSWQLFVDWWAARRWVRPRDIRAE